MKRLSFKQLFIIHCSLFIVLFAGCKKDSKSDFHYSANGAFVINQGLFPNGSGTITFIDRDDRTLIPDLFKTVNNFELGNTVQSMTIFKGKAYIVVNNSGKIEIANISDFKSTGVITGLSSPRYFLGIDSTKAYVSDWPNNVAVIDLKTLTVTKNKNIYSGIGPERMLKYNDKVFALNKYNSTFYSYDSTVTVIDTKTDAQITKFQVFNVPTDIFIDKNNKLWILCSGRGYDGFSASTDSKGHLLMINPDSYAVEKDLEFPTTANHPSMMTINGNGDMLYYVYKNGIYKYNINDVSIPANPLTTIDSKLTINAIGYDKVTDYLYAAILIDYTQNGYFYRFDSSTGTQVDSYQAGIIPGNFSFN